MQNAECRMAALPILHSAFCIRSAGGAPPVIVIKFGGPSVGDADRVANAVAIVAKRQHLRPIVVVSALSGITNQLIAATEAAKAGDQERVDQILDEVLRRHENVAMHLVQQKEDLFKNFLTKLHNE